MCSRPLKLRQRNEGAKYCSNVCKGDAFRGRPRPRVSRALKGVKKSPEMRAKLSAYALSRPRKAGRFMTGEEERASLALARKKAKLSAFAKERHRKDGGFVAKMQS